MTEPPRTLELISVSKRYTSGSEEVLACDKVDLSATPGTLTCIHGVSGAGKSTLIRIASGIEQPDEGIVRYGTAELSRMSEAERAALRRTSIGVIFQEHLLFDEFTAVENVSLFAELAGVGRRTALDEARRSLAACGVEELADRFPHQMSGGQRQRVAVARGWSGTRSLLLADEPTAALDSSNAVSVFGTLRALADQGACVVVATHDTRCGDFADTVLRMLDGRLDRERDS